jgi:2-methylisocitrate lyase-like PEP mutase family enzyme
MLTTTREQQAEALRALHSAPPPLVLANVWDVASAVLVASLPGCRALATSSAGVAAVLGYPDGERIPALEMLDMVRRIAAAVDVPVTADLEAGYGDAAATARAVWEAGAVGLNLEDAAGPADVHAERVRAVRAAVPALVVNARTDLYLMGRPDFDETVRRAAAYRAAGADSIFVPGVSDAETIGRLAAAIDAPLNVLAVPGTPPVAELERLGVARISVGSGLGRAALAWARDAAAAILDTGSFDVLAGAIPFAELGNLLEDGLESASRRGVEQSGSSPGS